MRCLRGCLSPGEIKVNEIAVINEKDCVDCGASIDEIFRTSAVSVD